MRLIPDRDAVDLASMLRDLLHAECPTRLVRELRESPALSEPESLWKALADAGVLGLATAEEYGGSGGGLADLGFFYVEAGRALCPMAIHSTVQAGLAIDLLGGPEQKAAWFPGSVRERCEERPRCQVCVMQASSLRCCMRSRRRTAGVSVAQSISSPMPKARMFLWYRLPMCRTNARWDSW